MEISGTEYSAEALMKEIEKEIVFMDRSEGGVTFCGGGAVVASRTVTGLVTPLAGTGDTSGVDTTLFARPEIVRDVMDNCELFLVDLKQMDSAKHAKYCGVPNELILSNLRMVAEARHDFYLRIPLIEGVNADEENITRSAAFLASLPWEHRIVNLLPYHDIGKSKHEKLGTVYNPDRYAFAAPSDETLGRCREIFACYGIETTIGG